MASGTLGSVAKGVARLFGEGTVSGLDDEQLLDRFLTGRDAVAFGCLVERHGPMVLAVCRRVLRDDHTADDAFQATFLLLVRKARTIRAADGLGPWLHRVALRVSLRASRGVAKRRAKELSSPALLDRATTAEPPDREISRALHEAVDSLPEKYRVPIVMCYLEGRTHDEAAISLRWPIGSVKGRLSRGREVLKARLARRGVLAPAGLILAGLSTEAGASVPSILHDATVEAAIHFAAGKATATLAAGMSSVGAAVLAEEAARAMTIKKVATIAATLLGLIGGGAAVFARQDGGKPANAKKTDEPTGLVTHKPEAPKNDGVAAEAKKAGEPTGAEVEENLRNQAKLLSDDARARFLGAVDDIEFDIELLREEVRDLVKQIRQTEFEVMVLDSTPGGVPKKRASEAIQKLKERLVEVRRGLSDRKLQLHHEQTQADRATAQIEALLAKADEAALRPGKPNTVQVGDTIQVEVLEALPGRPISGERYVRPDGTISMGFYGDLPVVGLTRGEIKVKVIERLQLHLTDESLGLLAARPDNTGFVKILPINSDRVFVDDLPYPPKRAGASVGDLERRMEKVITDREARSRARRDRAPFLLKP